MLKELLIDYNISEEKITKLNELREFCLEYNKHTNLTSITDEHEFNVKHILDSVSILKYHELDNKKILDVGSGGGFPGLVLAILLDNSNITMLDSNNKKTKYIDEAITHLGLTNASTINARIEEANLEEKFDVTLSRAVASLNILLEITAASVKVEGKAIYYKGSNLNEELPLTWDGVENKLGLRLDEDHLFELDSETNRRIISFNKFKSTHSDYPRHYSVIKKKPIY